MGTEGEVREGVRRALDGVIEEHRERLESIADEANAVLDRYGRLYAQLGEEVAAHYSNRYRRLGERYERHVEDIQARLEVATEEAREEMENLEVDLPEPPREKWWARKRGTAGFSIATETFSIRPGFSGDVKAKSSAGLPDNTPR